VKPLGCSPKIQFFSYRYRLILGSSSMRTSGTRLSPERFVNNKTDQRTAVVTGGSSGIGLAIARTLAAGGYHVAVVARDTERLQHAAAEIGAAASWYDGDLSQRQVVESVAQLITQDLGRIDVLVNNAGFGRTVGANTPLPEAEAVWDEVLSGNLKSTFLLSLAVLPYLDFTRRTDHQYQFHCSTGRQQSSRWFSLRRCQSRSLGFHFQPRS
jgi:NAD(P)-dependent dehydrogenase (short-subunit alcohol dehydrogenase family)